MIIQYKIVNWIIQGICIEFVLEKDILLSHKDIFANTAIAVAWIGAISGVYIVTIPGTYIGVTACAYVGGLFGIHIVRIASTTLRQ